METDDVNVEHFCNRFVPEEEDGEGRSWIQENGELAVRRHCVGV